MSARYICHKKAQVIVISLWILLILTMLAMSISHRVALSLRLTRYQKESLKAIALAKAGLNRAIIELEKDLMQEPHANYDALDESWAKNEEAFKTIVLTAQENEFATVKYTLLEDNEEETIFGVQNEERKININTAKQELLVALLKEFNLQEPELLAANIRAWRGDADGITEVNTNYEDLGYACKADKFTNINELILVKGITSEIYDSLRGLISVYGEGKVNINTASPLVLTLLAESITDPNAAQFIGSLVAQIINFREGPNGPFKSETDINNFSQSLTEPLEQNIFTALTDFLIIKSNYFNIESTGIVGKVNKKITAVYDRANKKIIFWHEN